MDFHPVIVATGQIISRLQLTWKGHTTNSNTPQATTSAFYRLYALACVYWIFRVLNFAIVAFLDSSADEEPSNWYYFVCALDDILWYGYFAFCIYVLKNIRCVYLFVCVCLFVPWFGVCQQDTFVVWLNLFCFCWSLPSLSSLSCTQIPLASQIFDTRRWYSLCSGWIRRLLLFFGLSVLNCRTNVAPHGRLWYPSCAMVLRNRLVSHRPSDCIKSLETNK